MSEEIWSCELEECIDSFDSSQDKTLAYICTLLKPPVTERSIPIRPFDSWRGSVVAPHNS
jgi:hypothetical protein